MKVYIQVSENLELVAKLLTQENIIWPDANIKIVFIC